jgi:hypothetical protein
MRKEIKRTYFENIWNKRNKEVEMKTDTMEKFIWESWSEISMAEKANEETYYEENIGFFFLSENEQQKIRYTQVVPK